MGPLTRAITLFYALCAPLRPPPPHGAYPAPAAALCSPCLLPCLHSPSWGKHPKETSSFSPLHPLPSSKSSPHLLPSLVPFFPRHSLLPSTLSSPLPLHTSSPPTWWCYQHKGIPPKGHFTNPLPPSTMKLLPPSSAPSLPPLLYLHQGGATSARACPPSVNSPTPPTCQTPTSSGSNPGLRTTCWSSSLNRKGQRCFSSRAFKGLMTPSPTPWTVAPAGVCPRVGRGRLNSVSLGRAKGASLRKPSEVKQFQVSPLGPGACLRVGRGRLIAAQGPKVLLFSSYTLDRCPSKCVPVFALSWG